jgi:hypothetical protein
MRPGSAPIQRNKQVATSNSNHNTSQHKASQLQPQNKKSKPPSFGNLGFFLNDENFHSTATSSSKELSKHSDRSADEISSKPSSKSSKPDFDLNSLSRGHRLTTVANTNFGKMNKHRHVNPLVYFSQNSHLDLGLTFQESKESFVKQNLKSHQNIKR